MGPVIALAGQYLSVERLDRGPETGHAHHRAEEFHLAGLLQRHADLPQILGLARLGHPRRDLWRDWRAVRFLGHPCAHRLAIGALRRTALQLPVELVPGALLRGEKAAVGAVHAASSVISARAVPLRI